MDDLMNDLADEMEENKNSRIVRDRRSSLQTVSQGKILLFGGAGLLVLIILILLLFLGGDGGSKQDLSFIEARLSRLEDRIKNTGVQEDRIREIEEQQKAFRQSLLVMDRSLRTLKEDFNQLAAAYENLQQKKAPAPPKAEVSQPVKKEATPQPKTGYHVVSRGETLYRISKKYGISVDELRRLNNMDPSSLIHPGQELMISPEAGK
jgi:LysM repeat protein